MKTIAVLITAILTLVGQSVTANAKPKIAVLGLEVIDNGSVDRKATDAAQALADELRGEASRSDGKYSLAPNSAKDLLELKLLSDCSDEGRTCMAAIGKDLGADRLLYGKIESHKKGYQVSLKLLNTNTKEMEKTTSELIPAEDLHSGKINKWAGSLYARLIGVPESGTLAIDANIDKATIYIDGDVATTLRGGSAKVLGLSEGTHTVTIEAQGYKRYEAEVAITAGLTEDLSISLTPLRNSKPGGDKASSGRLSKIAFVGGVLVTAGLGAGIAYNGLQVRGELDDNKDEKWKALHSQNRDAYEAIRGGTTGTVKDACGKAQRYDGASDESLTAYIKACKDGEDAAARTDLFIAGTAVAALATMYFGYHGWIVHGEKSNKERRSYTKNKSKGRRVVVVPQWSAESVGAGLTLEF